MKKLLLLFVVLGGIVYLSGCNDYKNCTCTETTYDDSNNATYETYDDTVPEDKNCDDLNGHNADGDIFITCVGNH